MTSRYTVYLLYQYKSTNLLTQQHIPSRRHPDRGVRGTLLALLVQKYKY